MSPNKRKRFSSVPQADVPHGRRGKHKQIIDDILDGLLHLKDGNALKIPLNEIASKEKVRSALNRATRKAEKNIATAADSEFLYIWNSKNGHGRNDD
jgi:lambda repressor-like predicted transcriptional regulator